MDKDDFEVEDATLLWRMSQMQDLFVTHRMWPSFVGAKDVKKIAYTDHGKSQNISEDYKLPVLLWPEQKRYLAGKGYANYGDEKAPSQGQQNSGANEIDDISVIGNGATKKRKRNEEESVDDDEILPSSGGKAGGEGVPLKKARTVGFFEGLVGYFSGAFSRVKRLVTPHRRMTNADMQSAIFAKCQNLGYFIGPGHVYGGDYNIYRGGDPSNSHSTATIRVVRKRTITGHDLLSFSRVQNQVAKSAVLAFVDPELGDARFLVANFQNVSERL